MMNFILKFFAAIILGVTAFWMLGGTIAILWFFDLLMEGYTSRLY